MFHSYKHQKHDSRSTRHTTGKEGIVFLRFSAAKHIKNTIPAHMWQGTRCSVPQQEGIVVLTFSAAKQHQKQGRG